MYYLNARYYNPEWRRFISPDNVENLNPNIVNGLNLYCYANNNPVEIMYSGLVLDKNISSLLTRQEINSLTVTYLEKTNNKFTSKNHWENEWISTELNSFLVLTNESLELTNLSGSLYMGSLYLNDAKTHSVYVSAVNLSAYAGINFDKMKFGVKLGGELAKVGFDGKFIDASIDLVGAGYFFCFEKGKLQIKADPIGTPGLTISIDFGAIIEEIIRLFRGG